MSFTHPCPEDASAAKGGRRTAPSLAILAVLVLTLPERAVTLYFSAVMEFLRLPEVCNESQEEYGARLGSAAMQLCQVAASAGYPGATNEEAERLLRKLAEQEGSVDLCCVSEEQLERVFGRHSVVMAFLAAYLPEAGTYPELFGRGPGEAEARLRRMMPGEAWEVSPADWGPHLREWAFRCDDSAGPQWGGALSRPSVAWREEGPWVPCCKVPASATRLMRAARLGRAEDVEAFVCRGRTAELLARGEVRDSRGRGPLSVMAERGHEAAAEALLRAGGAELSWAADADGQTAAAWAAGEGHVGVLRVLLRYGGLRAVGAADSKGVTPLMRASAGGHVEAVRVLLQEGGGVDVRATDAQGWGAVRWSVERGQPGPLLVLLQALPEAEAVVMGRRALLRSAELGLVACVRAVVEGVAWGRSLLQARDEQTGEPVMVWAVRGGRAAAVEYLLSQGADCAIRSAAGLPLLSLAVTHWREDVVALLLRRLAGKAALEERDAQEERTALGWAALWGSAGSVRLLLEAGADGRARDRHGKSAQDWAREMGYEDVLRVLAEHHHQHQPAPAAAAAEQGPGVREAEDDWAWLARQGGLGRTVLRAGDVVVKMAEPCYGRPETYSDGKG